MQSDRGAQQRNDFQLRLHAIDMQKGSLVRRFMTVDGQVADVHAQAERNGVKLAKFDASTGEFFSRRDYAAADSLLKGIGSDIPGEQAEGNQGENAERQE